MDLVFLFDSSISVGEEKFRKQLEFAKGVIEPLEFASGRTQVAAVTYSNEAYVQWQVIYDLELVDGIMRRISVST